MFEKERERVRAKASDTHSEARRDEMSEVDRGTV
jgi:hypothetical protein